MKLWYMSPSAVWIQNWDKNTCLLDWNWKEDCLAFVNSGDDLCNFMHYLCSLEELGI